MNKLVSRLELILDYHGVDLWGTCDEKQLPAGLAPLPRGLVLALAITDMSQWLMIKRSGRTVLVAEMLVRECLMDVAASLNRQGYRTSVVMGQGMGSVSLVEMGSVAGLGSRGNNGLLITKPHGPWVQLGALFTAAPLPDTANNDLGQCCGCNQCVEQCPVGALVDGGINRDLCSEVVGHKLAFQPSPGSYVECTICLDVCPAGSRPASFNVR